MSVDFKGLRVFSFESRKAPEMAELIRAAGGTPVMAPSMREIPLEQNSEALTFAKLLLAGWIDIRGVFWIAGGIHLVAAALLQ